MSAAEQPFETIRIAPLSPRIGAEISGFRMNGDLAALRKEP